jgi:hypothetical protein
VNLSLRATHSALAAGSGPHSSGIGVCAGRTFHLQHIGASHAQMGQGSCRTIPNDAAVIDNFLKFSGGFPSLS